MMKYLVVLAVLFVSMGLHAFDYSLLSSSFVISATHQAMGMEGSGVADVWNSDPLMSFHNPALAAYQPGFSYSVIKYDIPWRDVITMNHEAAAAVIGYNGIALILPAPALNGTWGNYFDCGEYGYIDANNEVVTYHPYDAYRSYGLAINPLETYRAYSASYSPLLNHFDLAVGFNYLDIESVNVKNMNNEAKGETGMYNVGLAAKLQQTFYQYVNAEASFGLARSNLGDDNIKYHEDLPEDPITQYTNIGYGVNLSLSSDLMKLPVVSDRLKYDNLASFKVLRGKSDLKGERGTEYKSTGIEFGLLDTIYLRQGKQEEEYYYYSVSNEGESILVKEHNTYDTSGWGIKLNILNGLSLKYNSASFPWGDFGIKDSYDLGINIDFMKMMGN